MPRPDRLLNIEARYAADALTPSDYEWLIDEVKRLRVAPVSEAGEAPKENER